MTVIGTGATPAAAHAEPTSVGAPLAIPADARRARVRGTLAAYLALTKPRIIELLLVTTVPTMFLAAEGVPPITIVVATLIGGTLAAGAANSLNCFIDRDIDEVMSRTGHRPLATHEVTPRAALTFGLSLAGVSLAVMAWVNTLSMALTAFAIAFYVLVYTLGLKRRTASNIVWGGIAGCMPVLIGWSAVTGSLAAPAWLLFLVVFWWTPPHFWALALKFRDDYAAAGVPMLPVVADPRVVVRRILGHSTAMVGASLVLWWVAELSVVYLVSAAVLGAAFLAVAIALRSRVVAGQPEQQWKPMRLFHWSITYLTLLFVMVGVDPLLPW
ncbi:MAG TPA: heme o synthase [Actinomycetes bacterium]|nr:heme o synthase [Actinomycetes bacterium]